MEDDKFKMTDYDQRRLIVDLLITTHIENSVMRTIVFSAISNGDPQKLQTMRKMFLEMYREASTRLREKVYANYGHIDLEDILEPRDG